MNERRTHSRKPAECKVRLYHPLLGSHTGHVEDWSSGGVRITCDSFTPNGHDLSQAYFQLETSFMDVIFTMAFVRSVKNGLVLRFVDDAQLVSGDRL